MSRVYNFSAGPAVLPEEVLKEDEEEMMDYQGTGMSVMEMSHRSAEFKAILADAEQNLRDIMNIPDNYKVMFIQGGGTLQFAMAPLNLLRKSGKADYVITGTWAKKAAKEAEKLGIKVSRLIVCDEVVLGEGPDVRRGLGGCLPVCKIIGAAALNGKSLEEITRLAQSFIDNMATVTIAFNDKEMKLNSGIRGENDGEIIASTTSDALAIEVTSMLIQDLQLQAGEVVYTMINTSGNINHIEAAIFGRDVLNALEQHDFVLASIVSGALFEMPETSVQVTLARMEQEVKSYLAAPCNSVAYKIK